MTSQVHETNLSIGQIAISQAGAGAEITLRIRLSCSDFCDLRGKIVNLIAPDASVKELVLTGFNGAENVVDDFVVQALGEPGSYTWTAVFPEQEHKGIAHLTSSASFAFDFKPHGTSMAVWDVPAPLVVGTRFAVKVGVRCTADCRLTDRPIEIYDEAGGKVASATLGPLAWPTTDALYWAEAQLQAPDTEGYYQWTVKFARSDDEPRHPEATYALGFATVKPPEHWVTVEVVDSTTKAPIPNARVVLHPYWGDTDEHGVARIGVTRGHHELYISESGKQVLRRGVEVAGDMALKAELLDIPPDLDMG